jgi:DNA-binding transcriptional LysR family regulator
MPDLVSLDLLVSVAELGSVGRAAQQHQISQPSASARLVQLERRFGVELLVRTSRGTTLTPAGEAVVAWAHVVVDAAGTLADGVASLRVGQQARLRVAASLTVAEYLLPGWLLTLRRRHPELEISASVANSAEVSATVRAGNVDMGFVETPDLPHDLSRHVVGEDRLALVVAAHYPLAARAQEVLRVADLLDQPLILREVGSGTRTTFLDAVHHAIGAVPSLPHLTTLGSTTTILATVRAGGGVGVVSVRAAASPLQSGELVELRVEGLDLRRSLHALWQGRRPGPLGGELLSIAQASWTGPRTT